MDVEEVYEIAVRVRSAIESQIAAASYVDCELKKFPRGSCEISSVILGLYLKSKGYENVFQGVGNRPIPNDMNKSNHVWLVLNNEIIVDITADQFNDCEERVIVGRESKFHKTFKQYALRPIDETYLNRFGSTGYRDFYLKVLSQLNCT